jgi:hypothetical protein
MRGGGGIAYWGEGHLSMPAQPDLTMVQQGGGAPVLHGDSLTRAGGHQKGLHCSRRRGGQENEQQQGQAENDGACRLLPLMMCGWVGGRGEWVGG